MTTSRSRRRFIRSGDGMAPYRTAALRAPLMRVPNNEDFAYALLLSRNPPPDVPVAPLDAMNRTIYERARSLGGSRMTWGSIPLTQADWIEHYGPVWDFFREAKERFDANNVLTPGPEIFPGAACAVEKDGSVTRSGARDLSSPDTVATQRRGERSMNQQQSWLISVVVLYLTLALSLGCVHAQVPAHVKKGIVDIPGSKGGNKGIERELIIGTGNISISVVTRTEEPLNPPCVVLVTRILDLTYTGIIQTLPKESAEASSVTHDAADRVVVNRCVDTPEGAFSRIDTLAAVMMAGRKGGLVIEVNGTFVGDVRSPAGVRNVAHLTIRGVTGELKGIRGRGLFVGRTSLTEGFNTYWVELQFDDDDF